MRNITLTAEPLEIQASDGQPATFNGVAYSGDVMPLGTFGQTLVNVGGMELPDRVSILIDHDNSIGAVAGSGRPYVEGGRLLVSGVIARGTAAGDQVIRLAKAEVPLQMSIGANLVEVHVIKAGKRIQANGKEHIAGNAGVKHVTKSRLREITITPLGADDQTSVSIAAKNGRIGMTEGLVADSELDIKAIVAELVKSTTDAIKASHAQELKLQRVCNGRPEILARAQAESWTPERAELEVLRASRPKPFLGDSGPAIHSKSRLPDSGLHAIEAALLIRAGHESVAVKEYGEQVCNSLNGLDKASVPTLMGAGLNLVGEHAPPGSHEVIKASISNHALTTALSNVSNLSVVAGYNELPKSFAEFSAEVSANDFKEHKVIRVTEGFNLETVAPSGDLHHGTMGEETFTYAIDTYGKLFSWSRKDMVNDSVQAFAQIAPAMGKAVARMELDVAYRLMLANVGTHFTSGRGNYATGSGTALSVTSIGAAMTAMRKQTDNYGNSIDIRPTVILTPVELEQATKVALESEYLAQTAVNTGTGNPVRSSLKLVLEPRLSNATFTGNSALAWYLFGPPSDMPFIHSYLHGQRQPTVEFFGLDSDPAKLAMQWRVYHDFGVGLGEYRAGYRAKGEA